MKNLPIWMTTVTPVSKVLAAIIFITLPFIGFFLGLSLPRPEATVINNSNSNISINKTATPTSTVVPTTIAAGTSHTPQIVTLNFDGKFSPTVLNIYKNDVVLVSSDTSCIQFATDADKLNKLQNVGYTLIGKKYPNNPDGESICGTQLADSVQSFSIQYKEAGKHKLYSFSCLNTQCISVNEDVNSYVPVIINVQ